MDTSQAGVTQIDQEEMATTVDWPIHPDDLDLLKGASVGRI